MLATVATACYQVLDHGLESLLVSHLLPIGVALTVWLLGVNLGRLRHIKRPHLFSLLDLLAAAPLLVAIALLIAVVPLFSEDLWRLAAEMKTGVIWLGLVTTFPMTVIVLWILLVTRFDKVVDQVAEGLRAPDDGKIEDLDPTIDELLARARTLEDERARRAANTRLRDRLARRRQRAPSPARRDPAQERILRGTFRSPAFAYYVRYMQSRLRWVLKTQVAVRVLLLITGIAVGFAAYIYAIAWIVVSADTAREWARRGASATFETPLGFSVPYGPHIWVAVVMAVIATAILLALVVTTSEMDTAFVTLSSHRPLRRCMSVAVPVADLWSELESGQPRKMDGASGAETGPAEIRSEGRRAPSGRRSASSGRPPSRSTPRSTRSEARATPSWRSTPGRVRACG